jgi:type II secretory pathway pseudopilin PulG
MSQVLIIISSLLAIVIGLWKYFTGKARKKQKRRVEAKNEIKQGMDENDPSKITSGLDNLNRN